MTSLMSKLSDTSPAVWTLLAVLPLAGVLLKGVLGELGDQNLSCLFAVLTRYGKVDFKAFMAKHRAAFKKGQETRDFVPGVCNYYSLMSDVITMASGPFWHFVPMLRGLSRRECHHRFHHTLTEYLEAKAGEKILELGCGFGEMGRQVAVISGASVTGLTMADEEITEGSRRIEAAGLKGQCCMVQGNYHQLPFEAEAFDKVFGVYTLKYSADLDLAIREAARVLKPGGKFVSYEILVTDKYDPSNEVQRSYVENISRSTCMPPLWHAQAFRDAAAKAGLVAAQELDLCGPNSGADPWYSCFETTGIYACLSSRLVQRAVRFGEALGALPCGFSDWFESCAVHPTTDFVNGGRLGIITGAVMMTWRKPSTTF